MDCIFLHVPKKLGDQLDILKMPLGLTALSWHLNQAGFSSRILHLTVEELIQSDFKIERYIRDQQISIVCLDLHWHQQSYSVMNTARQIKTVNPECRIILGGFTASLFAGEILANFPEIDFAIKGDAEVPLLRLIQALIGKNQALEDIPNLVWRESGQVKENDFNYVIDQTAFDRLEYFHLDLIAHHELYDRLHDFEYSLAKTPIPDILKGRSFAYYNAGRGCLVDCTYCGGGAQAQCRINQRRGMIIKSIPSVLKDIEGYLKFGIQNIYTCFDPLPARDHYLELFAAIKERGLNFDLHFECWSLPDVQFMEAFRNSFGPGSRLILSPDSGSEKIRKLNKGYFYTNAELIDTLDRMFKRKIQGQVYFSAGLPYETSAEVEETLALIILLKHKYGGFFKISFMLIELDPGSPMWFDHQKYQISTRRNTFRDLYNAHQAVPGLGYRSDTLSSKEISKLYLRIKKEIGST